MTLSESVKREALHNRTIELHGYARADGLWDIEGHLRDSKTYDFDSNWKGTVHAGTPFHEMLVRLTLDDDFLIKDVEVSMDATPFPVCCDIEPDFRVLIGERVGPGWRRLLRRLIGGTKGCTHVHELLGTMATAAFHTIATEKARRARTDKRATGDEYRIDSFMRGGKPLFIDGCHAWDSRGPLVKEKFPEYYRGKDE